METDEATAAAVAAYDEHAADYQQALRLRRPQADVRRFAAFARRHDLVLDAGCGPASDLRLLRDAGLHPVGLDLSMGALSTARLLLPHHPLVCAPITDPPFAPGSFQGAWISGGFSHLARRDWPQALTGLVRLCSRGPVYFSCLRGDDDLAERDDPVLGPVPVSSAHEDQVESLLAAQGLADLQVEVRPDPLLDRKRPWVVALGRLPER